MTDSYPYVEARDMTTVAAPFWLPKSFQSPAQDTIVPTCFAFTKKSVKSVELKLLGERLTPLAKLLVVSWFVGLFLGIAIITPKTITAMKTKAKTRVKRLFVSYTVGPFSTAQFYIFNVHLIEIDNQHFHRMLALGDLPPPLSVDQKFLFCLCFAPQPTCNHKLTQN